MVAVTCSDTQDRMHVCAFFSGRGLASARAGCRFSPPSVVLRVIGVAE